MTKEQEARFGDATADAVRIVQLHADGRALRAGVAEASAPEAEGPELLDLRDASRVAVFVVDALRTALIGYVAMGVSPALLLRERARQAKTWGALHALAAKEYTQVATDIEREIASISRASAEPLGVSGVEARAEVAAGELREVLTRHRTRDVAPASFSKPIDLTTFETPAPRVGGA